MDKTIVRVCKSKDNPYVMINKALLQDPGLTAKEKGIMSYILSLPDDWQIWVKEIENHFADGRDSIYSGFRGLIFKRYVVRIQRRSSLGQFIGFTYLVFENPQTPEKIKELTEYGKSVYGNPVNTNIDSTKDGFQQGKKPHSLTHYEADPMWRRAVDGVQRGA